METSKQKTVTFEFSTTDIVPEEMANTFIRNIVVGEYNPMKKAAVFVNQLSVGPFVLSTNRKLCHRIWQTHLLETLVVKT